MVYKFNWSPEAKRELKFIYEYLAFHLLEPQIALNNIQNIIYKVSSLSYFPERHPKLFYSRNYNIRKFCFKKFIILYQVDNFSHSVYILHIFHR